MPWCVLPWAQLLWDSLSFFQLLSLPGGRRSGYKTEIKTILPRENQDGGIGRHTAPPRTTRTDRESNGKGVRHQGSKKQTFI